MKLEGYPNLEYYFFSMNQNKKHIHTWWNDLRKGFGLCGADIGFSGDPDLPDDLYDIIGDSYPDGDICKKCLKIYKMRAK